MTIHVRQSVLVDLNSLKKVCTYLKFDEEKVSLRLILQFLFLLCFNSNALSSFTYKYE